MTERIDPSNLGAGREALATPKEKLAVLMDVLQALDNDEHGAIDPKLIEQAKKNQLQRIAELKKEYPELNN